MQRPTKLLQIDCMQQSNARNDVRNVPQALSLLPLTWCRHVELSHMHLKLQSLLRGDSIGERITALCDCPGALSAYGSERYGRIW